MDTQQNSQSQSCAQADVDPPYRAQNDKLCKVLTGEGVVVDDIAIDQEEGGSEKAVSINLGIDGTFVRYTMTVDADTQRCQTHIETYHKGEDLEFSRETSSVSEVGKLSEEEKRELKEEFGTQTAPVMKGLSLLQKHHAKLGLPG